MLIILYTAFSIIMPVTTFVCGFEACSHYLVYPIMPWAFILTQDFGFDFPWAIYPVFLLLNISAAYVIGAGAEWLYHIYTERRS
jgi:hypothetical protein